jgi:transposase
LDSIAGAARTIVGGVDTHLELHHAAVVDFAGEILGTRSFATTRAGYRAMLAWMRGFGELVRVGVEQTGTFGAGLTRHLALAGIPVLEVTGPDPAFRRAKGKDDTLDAIAAAKAALSGQRVSVAKDRSGQVEALRVLRVTRTTAVKCRRATLQTLRNTITAGPGRGPRSAAQPDPQAAAAHLRGLAPGPPRLPRSGHGDQDRLQVAGHKAV